MRLRTYSRGFFVIVMLALVANLGFLALIRHAEQSTHEAFEARDRTAGLLGELVRQNAQLAQLVQSFTTTAQTRYLTEYYAVLAARQGEGPTAGAPLIERMRQLSFSTDELGVAAEVLAAAERMQKIEQVAFAATQGLYDRASGEFVSDGQPDRAWATSLVHSPDYEAHWADLQRAVDRLVMLATRRTAADVERMRDRLGLAIGAAIAVDLALVPLLLAALVLVRRQVLGRSAASSRRRAASVPGTSAPAARTSVAACRNSGCCRGCWTTWPARSRATSRGATPIAASCRLRATPPKPPPRPSRASSPT